MSDITNKDIGLNLKNAREYTGLSEIVVAKKIGISIDELKLIEYGDSIIDRQQIEMFAKLYRHPVQFFYSGQFNDASPQQLLARAVGELSDLDRIQITRFANVLEELAK
ncbi:helix-turn-helix domain-containing protein [Paenibacillus harenae]|uniref:Transcriptional regulator with XRE-family HTH domain n=1 Tax=Paenibacillus harenae TaxID=306543 RepID=A0ABT9U930_PAEHA|nr:helix-turn-helix transcriptional regulator [Paenibacillus harenae]MDQ0114959.1 transcriptional regulator with XRE-family HTH domain [Paenibacillus harenae]